VKSPYFVSRPPGIYNTDGTAADELLTQTGANTGNLLFISALHRVISHQRAGSSIGFDPAEVREKHDGLVIPAANWLSSSSQWGGLARLIETANLPSVMVGLGAQSHSFETFPKLHPGTLRLVKVVAERSRSISVRGEYTASVLEHYGIKNIVVTGCPSLLWNLRPARVVKPPKKVKKVALSGTRSNIHAEIFGKRSPYTVGVMLSRLAMKLGLDYVVQTELPELRFALGRAATEPVSADEMDLAKNVYAESAERVASYLTKHAKVFFNVEQWLAYAKHQDFLIGTRLHGTIAALLAGTPAVLVLHDTRTAEAARYLRMPTVGAIELLEQGNIDVQAIYDRSDFDRFNQGQARYFNVFRRFFNQNSVPHHLPAISADQTGVAAKVACQ
jgi:hypothetical protein